ncbi:MAG: 1-acyl-sn-glycerol-3-phosphate acyltransferase [Firmicutes bacterium]|nr:1-acyl-sn-glycerol-3-phosphate acyltransferase [Bacillota bacterium]
MYNFLRKLVLKFFDLIYGVRVFGEENIPNKGAAILAANHVSYLDPILVCCCVQRPVHFMAKAELFKYPILRQFFCKLNAFPVKRGMADRSAIRHSIDVLTQNKLLGIFPEGTRANVDEMLPIQGGAALIAIKTGAPIIPIVVRGVADRRFRKPMTVIIGEPIRVEKQNKVSKEDVKNLTTKMKAQFDELLRKEYSII